MIRRLVFFVLVLAVIAVLVVAVFPEIAGLQRQYYVAQVVAFRGALVVVGVVAAIVLLFAGLLLRPVRGLFGAIAVLLLVFAAVNGAFLFERGIGSTKFDDPNGVAVGKGGDVTVMAWNTRGSDADDREVARLAASVKADVVSLPETTRAHAVAIAAALKKAGRPMQVLNLSYDQVNSGESTSLLISTKLGVYRASTDRGTTAVLPTVVARPTSGTGPVIVAAHPAAPVKVLMNDWRSGLRYLSKLCSGESMIMAGDFNSTLDHQSGLASKPSTTLGSCRDAAKASGNAGVGTWPTNVPSLLGTPIDHVMATADWKFTGFRVITSEDDAGSDHRPVVAQLTPGTD